MYDIIIEVRALMLDKKYASVWFIGDSLSASSEKSDRVDHRRDLMIDLRYPLISRDAQDAIRMMPAESSASLSR